MSDRDQELIDSLRRCYQALNRGDFDWAMQLLHPEVEFDRTGGLPTLRGAEALRAWVEPDALEDQRWEPLEFRVHDRKVLVRQNTRARGASTGIELDVESWVVWTFDGMDRVTRVAAFSRGQEEEALEAAGLSE